MQKKYAVISVVTGALIIAVGLVRFTLHGHTPKPSLALSPADVLSASTPRPNTANGDDSDAFIKPAPNTLETVTTALNCTKSDEARARSKENEISFVPGEESNDFVYLNTADGVVTVCFLGQEISANLSTDFAGLSHDELEIRVTDAQIRMVNGKKTFEFLYFTGQCVEGPCLGTTTLYRYDGDKIKSVYILNADMVLRSETNPAAYELQRYCFTYDFGIAFEYFAVAEFKDNGEASLVPVQELRHKYLEQVNKLKPRPRDHTVTPTADDLNFDKMKNIIFAAYTGTLKADLVRSYEDLLKGLPQDQGMTSGSLPVHCDAPKIIDMISQPNFR